MSKYQSAAWETDEEGSLIKKEVKSIANHTQNNTTIDTASRTIGELPLNSADYSDEDTFAYAVRNHLDENYSMKQDENVVFGHGNSLFGYGGDYEFPAYKFSLSLVYVGGFISKWEKKQMAWHEAAHNWGATHEDGGYSRDEEPYDDDYLIDVTPMASSYLYDNDDECDMPWAGSGNPVDPDDGETFCNGLENYPSDSEALKTNDAHILSYSDCTLSAIESEFS